jgi:hypothetical protein
LDAAFLQIPVKRSSDRRLNESMPPLGRRHDAHFPPHQFMGIAVFRQRQEFV